MRLRSLTALEQNKLEDDYNTLQREIEFFESILNDPEVCRTVIRDELIEIRENTAMTAAPT